MTIDLRRAGRLTAIAILGGAAGGAAAQDPLTVADFLALAKGREGDLRLNHGPDLDWSIQQLAAKMKPKPKRKPRSPKP